MNDALPTNTQLLDAIGFTTHWDGNGPDVPDILSSLDDQNRYLVPVLRANRLWLDVGFGGEHSYPYAYLHEFDPGSSVNVGQWSAYCDTPAHSVAACVAKCFGILP